MKILALDTAARFCAAAVYDAGSETVLAAVSEDIGKGHAEVLMDHVERALAEAGLSIGEIGRIAVNVGPGSFTGVRIGVSAARGFALALRCPAIGVTAFEALAAETSALFPARPVTVFLDAHRGEIYTQSFDEAGTPASQPAVMTREEAEGFAAGLLSETVLAGSAAGAIGEALGSRFALGADGPTGRIGTYARLAARRPAGEAPKPLYMRGPDAKPQTGFALARRPAGD